MTAAMMSTYPVTVAFGLPYATARERRLGIARSMVVRFAQKRRVTLNRMRVSGGGVHFGEPFGHWWIGWYA